MACTTQSERNLAPKREIEATEATNGVAVALFAAAAAACRMC
jgi:hypothetical protein